MIGKVVTAAGAVLTPVAAAALDNAKATPVPTIWYFFGTPFEAGGMVAALFGCLAARWWIAAGQALRKEHRWSVDIPATAMTVATSAALVISIRPGALTGLMLGAGIGIIGEGLFTIAERQARASGALGPLPAAPEPARADPDNVAGIGAALRSLDAPPNP